MMNINRKIIKVCLICGTYPDIQCGVGLHTFFLAEGLVKQGLKVFVITTNSPQISKSLIKKENPRVYPFIKHWNFFSPFKIRSLISKINPDIVHLQLPTRINKISGIIVLPLLKLLLRQKPLALTLHEFSEGRWLSKIRGILLISNLPYLIFPSQNDLKLAQKIFPFLQGRFFHVPLGPTLPFNKLKNNEKKIQKDKNSIAYLGILYPGKGLETLLRAIALVNSRIPQIRLHILGSLFPEDSYHRSIEKLIEKLGVHKNIILYSNLKSENIVKKLLGCYITCLPYPKGATFRRSTLLEALTAGTAVVTTQSRLTPKELIHGKNIYFVPADDPTALSEAIERLYYDDNLIESLIKNGKELSRKFNWCQIAIKTAKIYQQIIEKRIK